MERNRKVKTQILKTYGLTKDEIKEKLSDIIRNNNQLKITIKDKYLDSTIDISGEIEDTIAVVTRDIMRVLGDHVYAESYQTLYERLADLLAVRNKKICLFEQGSGSIITSNLMAIDGAGKYISESLTLPSVDSWLTKFDINPRILRESSGLSSKLVFMIASSLRRKCLADYYVVAVSSDAYGLEVYNLENKEQESISLVAIGDSNGVEIYKQTLSGTPRDKNNQTAKSICYKLIQELKK